jgi:drug/metabolite transporter (DMT)-like permease
MEHGAVKRLLAYAAIYVLWGASFLAIKVVVAVVPPFLAAGIRFLSAGAMLLLFSFWRKQPQPEGPEWRNLLLLAGILFIGDYALLFWAEQRLASGLAAVLAATIPTQVYLLEWLWLRRVRISPTAALGLALGLGGVAALVLPSSLLKARAEVNLYAPVALLAATCWAVGTVLSTRLALPKARQVNAGWQMTLGGTLLLALSAGAGEWRRLSTASLTPRVWLSMAYLIVFASLAAFSAYIYLLAHAPARRVASYAYVNPIIALLLGSWLGGESISPRQGIACAVVIAGVLATLLGREGASQQPVAVEG